MLAATNILKGDRISYGFEHLLNHHMDDSLHVWRINELLNDLAKRVNAIEFSLHASAVRSGLQVI